MHARCKQVYATALVCAGAAPQAGAQDLTEQARVAAAETKANVQQGADTLANKAKGAAADVQAGAQDLTEQARMAASETKANVQQGADTLASKAKGAAADVQAGVQDLTEQARIKAGDALAAGANTIGKAADAVGDATQVSSACNVSHAYGCADS